MAAYELRFSNYDRLVQKIKGWRGFLLRRGGPDDYLFIHRNLAIDHEYSQACICDPVVITQNDFRPSLYFAREIMCPVFH